MTTPFKKVIAGQKLRGNVSARGWNKLMELAQEGPDLTGRGEPPPSRQSTVVFVKNDSGSAKDQFDVLGLDGPIITPTANETEFKRQVTFSGITPTTASHSSKFCILLEPLADGAIGKAVVAGVVQVRLTGADVGFAAVTNNDATKLTASATGVAQVLYAEAGSSERWAIVRLRSGGLTAITVEEADGTPSYTDITKIQFDQASKLKVTQPSAGVAKVEIEGLTSTETIVTAVSCNSGTLSVTTKDFDFVDGILQTVT